jgi:hypothetical protein
MKHQVVNDVRGKLGRRATRGWSEAGLSVLPIRVNRCMESHTTRREESSDSMFPLTQWTALLKPIAERSPNEREALERLFEIYRPPIVSFIRAHERNKEEAEDLAHDFIMKLLRNDDPVG